VGDTGIEPGKIKPDQLGAAVWDTAAKMAAREVATQLGRVHAKRLAASGAAILRSHADQLVAGYRPALC
jgi:hypothetical protein